MVPVERQPSMATLRELEHGVRQLEQLGMLHEEAMRVLATCRGLVLSLPGRQGDAEETAKAANVFLKAYLEAKMKSAPMAELCTGHDQ